MQKLNKKGASGIAMLLVIGILAMVGLFGYWVLVQSPAPAQQTALQLADQTAQLSLATGAGELALTKVRVVDKSSSNQAQVSAPFSCWDTKNPKVLLVDGTVSSSTSDTSVTVFSKGQNVHCEAFNASWYPEADDNGVVGVEQLITSGGELIQIPVRRVSSSLLMELQYRNSIMDVNNEINVSGVGASGEFSFDWVKVKNNLTYTSYMLKSFVIDTVANTNITDITLLSGDKAVVENSVRPQRLGDSANYRFDLPVAERLDAYETFTTGSLTFKADGDGCVSAGGLESLTLRVLDEQRFKSALANPANVVLAGVENDNPTPADVGASDKSIAFTCTSDAV